MQAPEIFLKLKPGITKRALLFVAGCLWTFAGSLLLFRGLRFLVLEHSHLLKSLFIGACGGFLFFYLVFYRVSGKYIKRITRLSAEKPCFFAFFSWKSYLIMSVMITMGITLSKLHLFHPHPLHVFFVIMSLPLLFSGLRFFYNGIIYEPKVNFKV